MQVQVAIVNAFVDHQQGGNPAGIVLDADHLDDQQKLAVARRVGLSETAFVSASTTADFKLDFFTPNRQIAHCGHATVATFGLLAQQGKLSGDRASKETIDGNRAIHIRQDQAFMEQQAPGFRELAEQSASVAAALGLDEADLTTTPMWVNTGNSFLVVGVGSRRQLAAIRPDPARIGALSEALDLIGFYVFSLESNLPGRDASARMFAPRFGISEEAATGMAAGPLACYLHRYHHPDQLHFLIEQGYATTPASPSVIAVELVEAQGRITGLYAGGAAVVSRQLTVVL